MHYPLLLLEGLLYTVYRDYICLIFIRIFTIVQHIYNKSYFTYFIDLT